MVTLGDLSLYARVCKFTVHSLNKDQQREIPVCMCVRACFLTYILK